MVGQTPCRAKIDVKFYAVKVLSAYNVIFERTTLTSLRVVTSISHLKMKFPIENGIRVINGCQKTSQQLYIDELKQVDPDHETGKGKEVCMAIENIKMEKFRESFTKPLGEPEDEAEEVELVISNREKLVKVGKGLETSIREKLISLLQKFSDMFSWSPKDIPEIPEEIAVYRLSMNNEKKPMRQKKRNHIAE